MSRFEMTGLVRANDKGDLPMKKICHIRLLFPVFVFLGSLAGYAQTPTLSLARGNTGITSGQNGRASNFQFFMEPSGWPRAVTAGETVFLMGSWPTGNNPTITDDKSNTWRSVTSCNDGSMVHGFFYAVNAAANTSVINATHSSRIGDQVLDWAHFYNMSTTASGFVDGSSCTMNITPANNNSPNITGTAYTTGTNGDLILTCVYVQGLPGQILRNPDAITSITWPTGFTGLSEETFFGHACAYGIQTTAGSFTPTFTVAQATGNHRTFVIMSAAFKAGNGGQAPGNGPSVLLSQMHYTTGTGQTDNINLPCPSGTTAVVAADDFGALSGVTDSNSNSWSHVNVPGNFWGPIYYVNNPTITSANSYKLNLTLSSTGGYELLGLYCLGNTAGIDTGVTAANNSTLVAPGSGATYGGNQSGTIETDAPTIVTSLPGDLIIAAGGIGLGPAISCVTGHCVFDYVGATDWTGGDNESYANGDTMAHQYAPAAGTVQFQYNLAPGVEHGSGLALAFKAASGGTSPSAPTGLQATVH
jgi:hypothetical protein